MKLEKLRAPNSKAGMFSIYKQYGDDVVIYRTDETPNGVEILYGLPNYLYEKNESPENAEVVDLPHQVLDLFAYSATNNGKGASAEDKFEMINDRLQELTQMFAYMSETHLKYERQSDQKLLWTKMLTEMGFSLAFADKYFDQTSLHTSWVKKLTKTKVIKEIKKVIATLSVKHEFKEGVYTLIGASGVGKTTTLVKLANCFKKIHSKEEIGVITLDSEETTIKNSIGYYSNILQLPFELVSSIDEFNDVMTRMAKKKVILIDTFGVNPFNNNQVEEMNQYLKQIMRPSINALVVACNQQDLQIKETLRRCAKLNLHEVVLTKHDELPMIANTLSTVMDTKLPIRFVVDSKEIRQGIHEFNADKLVDQLMSQRVT